MSFLLDTHVLLWWISDEPLSEEATAAISEPEATVFVSAATIWEAEIKAQAGKLELDVDLIEQVRINHLFSLPIEVEHAAEAARLPEHHRDPFDRMLIAQARLEKLTLVTRDRAMSPYAGLSLLAA